MEETENIFIDKKKKKKNPIKFLDNNDVNKNSDEYDYLLNRALSKLYEQFPHKKNVENIKYRIKDPVITYSGKKTIYHNFLQHCAHFQRDYQHVLKYVHSELGCSNGRINSRNELILNDKVKNKTIEKILLDYVNKYIRCPTCQNPPFNTVMRRNLKNRLDYIFCYKCQSEYYPEPIQTNFYHHSFSKKRK